MTAIQNSESISSLTSDLDESQKGQKSQDELDRELLDETFGKQKTSIGETLKTGIDEAKHTAEKFVLTPAGSALKKMGAEVDKGVTEWFDKNNPISFELDNQEPLAVSVEQKATKAVEAFKDPEETTKYEAWKAKDFLKEGVNKLTADFRLKAKHIAQGAGYYKNRNITNVKDAEIDGIAQAWVDQIGARFNDPVIRESTAFKYEDFYNIDPVDIRNKDPRLFQRIEQRAEEMARNKKLGIGVYTKKEPEFIEILKEKEHVINRKDAQITELENEIARMKAVSKETDTLSPEERRIKLREQLYDKLKYEASGDDGEFRFTDFDTYTNDLTNEDIQDVRSRLSSEGFDWIGEKQEGSEDVTSVLIKKRPEPEPQDNNTETDAENRQEYKQKLLDQIAEGLEKSGDEEEYIFDNFEDYEEVLQDEDIQTVRQVLLDLGWDWESVKTVDPENLDKEITSYVVIKRRPDPKPTRQPQRTRR